jgi:hypothetical protein
MTGPERIIFISSPLDLQQKSELVSVFKAIEKQRVSLACCAKAEQTLNKTTAAHALMIRPFSMVWCVFPVWQIRLLHATAYGNLIQNHGLWPWFFTAISNNDEK